MILQLDTMHDSRFPDSHWERVGPGMRKRLQLIGFGTFPANHIPKRLGTPKNLDKPPHSRIPKILPYGGSAFWEALPEGRWAHRQPARPPSDDR
jgi:hypothetical protein